MLSASLLPSPGPALNKGGIVGRGSGADGGGGWRHQKEMYRLKKVSLCGGCNHPFMKNRRPDSTVTPGLSGPDQTGPYWVSCVQSRPLTWSVHASYLYKEQCCLLLTSTSELLLTAADNWDQFFHQLFWRKTTYALKVMSCIIGFQKQDFSAQQTAQRVVFLKVTPSRNLRLQSGFNNLRPRFLQHHLASAD